MSYKLTSKTKETLSRIIGIPYEKLIQMEDEEIEAFIEQRTWNKYQKNYDTQLFKIIKSHGFS